MAEVQLEKIYDRPGVPIKRYTVRGVNEERPPPVIHGSDYELDMLRRDSCQYT